LTSTANNGLELHGGPRPNVHGFTLGIHGGESTEHGGAGRSESRLQDADGARVQFIITIEKENQLMSCVR
jgi:hypothetical protein